MEELIKNLVTQSPGIAGIIIVVVLFIRYLDKRDGMFLSQLSEVVKRIEDLEELIHRHLTLYEERGKIIQRIDRNTTKKNK